MELIFPGPELARRLEASDAENARASSAEALEIAGGIAAFAGSNSPLTHAIGVGMDGPVSESDIDRIEDFYRSRDAASSIDVCPLADVTLSERLGRRGYRITEFNNVYCARITSSTPAAAVKETTDAELWVRTVITGFVERDELTPDEFLMGEFLTRMPGVALFLAEVEGVPVAGGAARRHGSLLTLFADSTQPRFRGRSLQKALIEQRLAWGAAQGAELATAATLPGTVSQRNYMRAGFQLAYTKVTLCRDL